MPERLPLFVLDTVLFPGVVLPLHVFEPRYRQLMDHLLAHDEPREFGILGVRRSGHPDDVESQLQRVGCIAQLRRIKVHGNGTSDIVVVGTERFRMTGLADTDDLYFVADVERLGMELDDSDEPGDFGGPGEPGEPGEPGGSGDPDHPAVPAGGPDEDRRLETRAVTTLARLLCSVYLEEVAALRGKPDLTVDPDELTHGPVALSWLIASAMVLTRAEAQSLLEVDSALARLEAEITLLRREVGLVRRFRSLPANAVELGSLPAEN